MKRGSKSSSGKGPKGKKTRKMRKKANRRALEQKIFKQIDNDLKKIDRNSIYSALAKDVEAKKVKMKSEIVSTGSVAFTPKDEEAKEQPQIEEADQYEDFDDVDNNTRSDDPTAKATEEAITASIFKTQTGMTSLGANQAPEGVVYKTQCFIRSIKEKNDEKSEAKAKAEGDGKSNIEGKSDKVKHMKTMKTMKTIKKIEKEDSTKVAKEKTEESSKESASEATKEAAKEATKESTKETAKEQSKEVSKDKKSGKKVETSKKVAKVASTKAK